MGERAACWLRPLPGRGPARSSSAARTPAWSSWPPTASASVPQWLSSQVHHYVRAADLGKTGSCHLFRHSAATLMVERGADIRYVQELLGHRRPRRRPTIYTRVAPERLAAIHAATHPGVHLEGRRAPPP